MKYLKIKLPKIIIVDRELTYYESNEWINLDIMMNFLNEAEQTANLILYQALLYDITFINGPLVISSNSLFDALMILNRCRNLNDSAQQRWHRIIY